MTGVDLGSGMVERYLAARARRQKRTAWLRLNAYGVLIVGLLCLSVLDLLSPDTSNVARIVGQVPRLQPVWAAAFLAAAVMMLWGFMRSLTWPEVVGLVVLNWALVVQDVVVSLAVGWGAQYAIRNYIVLGIVIGCSAARISVLLSRDGYTITVPSRSRSNGGSS